MTTNDVGDDVVLRYTAATDGPDIFMRDSARRMRTVCDVKEALLDLKRVILRALTDPWPTKPCLSGRRRMPRRSARASTIRWPTLDTCADQHHPDRERHVEGAPVSRYRIWEIAKTGHKELSRHILEVVAVQEVS